ncbi:MAG TPA: hypothetical protein PLG14_04815 [Spirochaetales bacterium]|nr:hypothetical protein [Spirochaetales bacterium]
MTSVAKERDFRFFGFGLPARLVLAGGLYLLGAGLDLALPGFGLVGVAVAAAGWLPLALRAATNKPDDQGLEEWRPVTMAEMDRLDDSLRETRKLRRLSRAASPALVAALAAPLLLFLALFGLAAGRRDLSFAAFYAVLFLVPSLFFGKVRVFLPMDIAMKMPSFREALAEERPEGVAVAPYLRFDKDPAGRDIPEDLRLMLELKRPPADLVGVQLQAAINKGPNGPVPYLYAVVLTRGTAGPSYALAKRLKADGFKVEAGGEGEFGTVVVRQATSGGGYYTSPDDCRRLARLCLAYLAKLAGS